MINDVEELKKAWEENVGYGVVLLVEDFHMQVLSIYMEDELYGMYPYPGEDGDALIMKATDLTYPVEVIYSDKNRLA